MLICRDCFKDEELKSEVGNESTEQGLCDVCGVQGALCNLDVFRDFFKEVLGLFEPNDDGVDVTTLVQKDWAIFSDNAFGKIILEDIITNDDSIGYGINTPVDYTAIIQEKVATWERLKEEVKENSRFFADVDSFKMYHLLDPNESLREGTILYRARVIPQGTKTLTRSKMGCPPKDKATAGRANPLGIPYLYLCEDIETTYYEVRAVYLDRLAVGKFRVLKNLKIVDFHFNLNLYIAYTDEELSLEDMVARKKTVEAISADLSRPLRRYDSELEYVPTQLICEYCKRMTEADGICFESSLHKGHSNYVLFDEDSVKCTKVEEHEIKHITITR